MLTFTVIRENRTSLTQQLQELLAKHSQSNARSLRTRLGALALIARSLALLQVEQDSRHLTSTSADALALVAAMKSIWTTDTLHLQQERKKLQRVILQTKAKLATGPKVANTLTL
jgi:hypothetical protein